MLSSFEASLRSIQDRILTVVPQNAYSVKQLKTAILKRLTDASDQKILSNKPHELYGLLKTSNPINKPAHIWEIRGGQRNFRRDRAVPHFSRSDGCWFDFSISLSEQKKVCEILGFDFEIRFSETIPVKFLRFDLNFPDHSNEEKGLRFHVHPGHDDLQIPAPPMTPLEILDLFLYGLELPDKIRTKG